MVQSIRHLVSSLLKLLPIKNLQFKIIIYKNYCIFICSDINQFKKMESVFKEYLKISEFAPLSLKKLSIDRQN
jgi:hypothetical protein